MYVYTHTIVYIYPHMQAIISKVIFACVFQTKAMMFN